MIRNQHYNIYIASCDQNGGIYHFDLDETGKLTKTCFTPMDRPMYMVIKDRKMYILLRAPFDDNNESGLVIYDIDDDGKLINPSEIISTKGEVACHLTVVDEKVYCVNYISGSVILLPEGKLAAHEGKGINPKRQESAHTHFVDVTPDDKYITVTDLGLDTIFIYDKNLNLINKAEVPKGHGVRHLIFYDDGKICFSANELESTVSVFEYNDGNLKIVDTVRALPEDFCKESTASAIRIDNGKIYVSNRGHNSISVFEYEDNKLKMTKTHSCFGDSPRDFDIIGDYIISTNEKSNSVTVLNKETMELVDVFNDILSPICVIGLNK